MISFSWNVSAAFTSRSASSLESGSRLYWYDAIVWLVGMKWSQLMSEEHLSWFRNKPHPFTPNHIIAHMAHFIQKDAIVASSVDNQGRWIKGWGDLLKGEWRDFGRKATELC